MSRIDSLTEARRGIGICCPCGKPARITVRGQNLGCGCFDRNVDADLDPTGDLDFDPRLLRRARHRLRRAHLTRTI